MTAIEAIKSIKVMLGVAQDGETANTLVEDVQLASATLLDGTRFEVEGENFEVGNQAYVITSEGERVEAPEGKHETTEGIVFTTDRVGVITAIDEVENGEAQEVEEVAAEAEDNLTLSADTVSQLINALDSISDKIEAIETKVNANHEEFHAFRNEPAGSRITNNLKHNQEIQGSVENARFAKIMEFRRNSLNK